MELQQKVTAKSSLQKDQVSQILARIKVGETGYTLVQTVENACEWYRDNMIVNVQEQLPLEWKSCRQVNYSTVFTEMARTEKTMQDCIQQYEERLSRSNRYMEDAQTSYLKSQEDLKKLRDKTEHDLKQRDSFVSSLIEKSSALKQKIIKLKTPE